MSAAQTNHEPVPAPVTILVAEDEVLVRIVTAEALREAGFAVTEAANGDEALRVLESPVQVDLLFTDIHMPGAVDGLALAGHARRLRPALKIMVTSSHAPAWPSAGLADEFVGKPYVFERLVSRIKKLTDNG